MKRTIGMTASTHQQPAINSSLQMSMSSSSQPRSRPRTRLPVHPASREQPHRIVKLKASTPAMGPPAKKRRTLEDLPATVASGSGVEPMVMDVVPQASTSGAAPGLVTAGPVLRSNGSRRCLKLKPAGPTGFSPPEKLIILPPLKKGARHGGQSAAHKGSGTSGRTLKLKSQGRVGSPPTKKMKLTQKPREAPWRFISGHDLFTIVYKELNTTAPKGYAKRKEAQFALEETLHLTNPVLYEWVQNKANAWNEMMGCPANNK